MDPIARRVKKRNQPLTEAQFLQQGRNRGPGTYTATETGAKAIAAQRNAFQTNRIMMNSAGSQGDFEDFISGKKRRK